MAVPWLLWFVGRGGWGLTCLCLSCQQSPYACSVAYAAAKVAVSFGLGFLESYKDLSSPWGGG